MKIVVQSRFNDTSNWEDYKLWRKWAKSEAISSVKTVNDFSGKVRFRVISRTEKVLYPKSQTT